MKSKPVALMLADLGVTKSHSRPHVSDDNPYSESQFKTLKYRPGFPDRFGSIQDSRAFCQGFFAWYNGEHRHSGIGLLTPETVHYGRAELVTRPRQLILASAFAAHPERFVHGTPMPPTLPEAAWINKPKTESPHLDFSRTPETAPIEKVSAKGPSADRRSWRVSGADSSDRVTEVTGNDIKFDKQVSQNC
jgi:putative transposase